VLVRPNGRVTFTFSVNARPAHATLRIRRGTSTVATLADSEYEPGTQAVPWDGRTARGTLARAGSYKAVLRATSSIATVTLVAPLRVR
jgi:flagellar hook assembly protein FlgD